MSIERLFEMPTAEQAYQASVSEKNKIIQDALIKTSAAIQRAIERGKLDTTVYGVPYNLVQAHLLSKGYTLGLRGNDQRDGEWFVIAWDKKMPA